jgi:hypothetical protein
MESESPLHLRSLFDVSPRQFIPELVMPFVKRCRTTVSGRPNLKIFQNFEAIPVAGARAGPPKEVNQANT